MGLIVILALMKLRIDEVKDLIEKSGLKFKAYECFMANDYSLEKALKFKNAITMAVVLNA